MATEYKWEQIASRDMRVGDITRLPQIGLFVPDRTWWLILAPPIVDGTSVMATCLSMTQERAVEFVVHENGGFPSTMERLIL